ncbi:hypothetical protein [Kitasatospora purpeofusca]|uniref:hypothetical protein n=1 Tax=Kitasatospora purpeofusca TaxID=67352 RepID=UPI002A5A1510|nr:hypothetical protein [Kitasatospora purpeofusca]MDY0816550.1 hypothetical protein [Kitasatospora purpeofusca]
MTPIELERITAHSYGDGPIGLDAQPLFASALTALQAREATQRAELIRRRQIRALRATASGALFRVVWHTQGSGKSMNMASLALEVQRIYDLLVADKSLRVSSFTTLLDSARTPRESGRPNVWHGLQKAVLDNSSPAAAGSPSPEPWEDLDAWEFSSRLARLHSGFELAAELATRCSPCAVTPASRPTGTEDLAQPLAIACGITRLQAPLIPRAPGRADAAGRFGVGACRLDASLAA